MSEHDDLGDVPVLTPEELEAALGASGDSLYLLDVRDAVTCEADPFPGAIHVDRLEVEERIATTIPDRSARIVVICDVGVRSLAAAAALRRLGYANAASLAGGIAAWYAAQEEPTTPEGLTDEQTRRYRRHLMMPDVGVEGQRKLLAARVLVIGAGGLGSPASIYLAAAGIGTLGVVDFDRVDESNLQRQILHNAERIGIPKTESARRTLHDLNPGIRVVPLETRLTSDNVEETISDWDIVLDGTDNFAARYAINDACVRLGKPHVHGSVYRFEGQVTVLSAPGGPCYRCIYPEPPAAELSPSCAEAGVLGVLPGVIGTLQAVETIKLVLGKGKPLIGRLLHYEALTAEFREFRVRRDPSCPSCGR